VPPASNPTATKEITDAQRKLSVVPVAKKSAPISFTPTHGVSKPPDVAMTVDGTFSESPLTRPIAPKPGMEKRLSSINKVFVSLDADVRSVSNWKWV